MDCPKCSGAMWDNRADKRNPKSPDFKCKNRSCGEGVWLDKQKPAANGNGNGASNGHAPVHTASSSRPLGPLYSECMDFAKKACAFHLGDVNPDAVIAATATLFIQAVKDGAPIRAAKPAPPPPPPPREPEPVYSDHDDLPF